VIALIKDNVVEQTLQHPKFPTLPMMQRILFEKVVEQATFLIE
jgi:hypothetical protein